MTRSISSLTPPTFIVRQPQLTLLKMQVGSPPFNRPKWQVEIHIEHLYMGTKMLFHKASQAIKNPPGSFVLEVM